MSKSDHLRKNAHALIIGINEYEDPRIPNLAFARKDAESLYKVLIDPERGRFSRENIIMLLDNNATERNIRTAIGRNISRKAGNEDLVFIYYAGHGSVEIDPKCRYKDRKEKYLVPSDAELDNLFSTGIAMNKIQEFFGRIESKQVIFFIDSCYSGEAGGRTFQNPRLKSRAILDNEFIGDISGEGRFIVTACDVNEVSLETKEIGHGLFTHYLIEGLKGSADKDRDGLVTINELYEYIYENVSQHARRVGGSMHPISKGSVKGKIFLSLYESEAQQKAKKINAQAQLHFNAKEYKEAYELWQQVKKLLPDHEEAKQGIMEIERIRDEEDSKKALEQKKRVLLNLCLNCQLPVEEFNLGMDMIEKSLDKLTEKESKIGRLLEALIKEKISVHNYLESVRLLRKKPESVIEPPESSESVRLPGKITEPVIEPPESSEKEDASQGEDILSFEEAYSKGEDQYKSSNYKSTIHLRKEPLSVSHAEFKDVFKLNKDLRPLEYIRNEYEDRGEVVVDNATGLMWQKSGSDETLIYQKAQAYIEILNNEQFSGHNNWRLPKIPELMSLLEPEKQSNRYFIDRVFDKSKQWCWSADKSSSGRAIVVDFNMGTVDWLVLNDDNYVRAVRS